MIKTSFREGKIGNVKFSMKNSIELKNVRRVRGTSEVRTSPSYYKPHYHFDIYINGNLVMQNVTIFTENIDSLKRDIKNRILLKFKKSI